MSDLPRWDVWRRPANPKFLFPLWPAIYNTTQVGTANRVFIQPLYVSRNMSINEILGVVAILSAGQNCRLGLYRDNTGTPAGGALLVDSGNISTGTATAKNFQFTAFQLTKGWYWVAHATSDAVHAFYRPSSSPAWIPAGAREPEVMQGCYYDLGAWGALTDPCPAVTVASIAKPMVFLHVASVDE